MRLTTAPSSGGAVGGAAPAFPGVAPDTLPPPPGGGFGFPNPVAPPYSVTNANSDLLYFSPDAPADPAPGRRRAAPGL